MSDPAPAFDGVRWLAEQLNTAQPDALFEAVRDPGVSITSSRTPAHAADQVDMLGEIQSIIESFGRVLAELHRIPLDGAPLPSGWDALSEVVGESAARVDASSLPDPYCRYPANELFAIWSNGRPSDDDLVVCHGNPALGNVLLHGSKLGGLLDLDGLRIADRHLDLAIAHTSIHERFGGDASYIFYDAYGTDPSLLKLDHYTLASHLLRHA